MPLSIVHCEAESAKAWFAIFQSAACGGLESRWVGVSGGLCQRLMFDSDQMVKMFKETADRTSRG
jgi:hypothetical protein